MERWGCLVDVEGFGFSARVPLLLHSGRHVAPITRSEGDPA